MVYTDHKPLLSLFTKEMVNTRIQRWAVLLAEYGAKILYRKGKNNIRADMLSRITEHELAVFDAGEEWVTLDEAGQHHTAFRPSETDDLDDQTIRCDQRLEFPDELARAQDANDEGFIMTHDLIYSISRPQQGVAVYPRLLLPTASRENIMKRCHEESGHARLLKTLQRVQDHYVWPGMRKDVQRYLDLCGLCRVHHDRPEYAPMGEMPIAQCPGEIVGIDLMGPLFESSLHSNKYICVVVDHYSGWVKAYPIASKANEHIWERLCNDYVPQHGAHKILVSDQGGEFHGEDFEQWLRKNNIEHR